MVLLALGVLVIAGVIGFNKWQELKHRRNARGFSSGHEDVLLTGRTASVRPQPATVAGAEEAGAPGLRIEPGWDGGPDAAQASRDLVEETPAGQEPSPAAGRSAAPARAAGALASAVLDERVDYIAELEFSSPLTAAQAGEVAAGLALPRTVGCDGFNGHANAWEGLGPDALYARIRVGMQLTDRGGPVREADLAAFARAIEAIGAEGGAQIAWTGAQNPLTRAVELDAFCAEVDVQIGISLVAGATFAETKFRGLAEANGFAREDDGVFRRRDNDGREILSLRQSAPAAVSLALDVPRVPREAAAFGLLAHCARTLAKGLDAKIVDDNQRVLDDAMLARIGQGVGNIHGRMEAAGIDAGGALALRLFA